MSDEEPLADERNYDNRLNGSTLQMKGQTNQGYKYGIEDKYDTRIDNPLYDRSYDVIYDNKTDTPINDEIDYDDKSNIITFDEDESLNNSSIIVNKPDAGNTRSVSPNSTTHSLSDSNNSTSNHAYPLYAEVKKGPKGKHVSYVQV